jgi:stalled ribosome rescue protein Dom34
MGVKDTGYTGESGLEELLNRSQDILSEARVVKEKSICLRFLEALRTSSRMVTYGWDDVIKVLKLGAVETVLLSEDLGKRVEIEKMAKETNTKVEIISRHTREGEQIWQLGGIAAILRYPVEE